MLYVKTSALDCQITLGVHDVMIAALYKINQYFGPSKLVVGYPCSA